MSTVPADTLSSSTTGSRARTWLIGLLLLILAGGLVWYYNLGHREPVPSGGRNRGGGAESIPVRVVAAEKRSIDVQLKALGTVTPFNTVVVRSRLDGELVKVSFTEGQRVEAGQVLAEIDPRPYETQLAQVLGQQRENQAKLKNLQDDLERFKTLFGQQLITGQQVTSQESLIEQLRGTIETNEAQIRNARLNLSYTKILAPISGRLGLRQVDAGNLVRANDTNGLVVLTQTRPISVIFAVPEPDLPAVLKVYRAGTTLPVEAWDRAETGKLADGTLQTIDNQIDTATGTIRLRAQFANADERLFPNQFVNIRLKVNTLTDATVIPAAAVQRASFGTFVYAVKPDSTATIRRITLGPSQGDRVAVTSGLDANEKIVLEGVDDLTEGAKVEVIPEGTAPRRPVNPQNGPGRGGRGGGGGGRR